MDGNARTPLLGERNNGGKNLGFTCRRLTIIPVLLAYYFALGMIQYIVPEYIHDKFDKDYASKHVDDTEALGNFTYDPCRSNESGPGYDRYVFVQQETAKWQNFFSLARNIPAVFANLIWASYSDVIGRKVLVVSCTAGYLVKMVLTTVVIHFNYNIALLLIGEFLDGVAGSYTTFLAVLFSYVADVTEPGSKRTTAIVLFELVLAVIISIATLGTGYYIKYTGFFWPSVTAAGATFVSVCLAILLVPETIAAKQSGGCDRLVSSISTAFKLYFKPESRLKQIKYFVLFLAFFFYTIQLMNRSSLETLYQLGKPFCWSSTKIGWFAFIKMNFISLVGMGGIFVLKRAMADDTIALVSSALTVISYVVEGLATTEKVLYTVPFLATMSVLPVPMIRSLMSRLTPAEKQGAVFATIGSLETVCSILGSLTSNLVYSATLSIMNGFVFLLLAAVTAIGGIIMAAFVCIRRRTVDETDLDGTVYKEIRVNDPPE